MDQAPVQASDSEFLWHLKEVRHLTDLPELADLSKRLNQAGSTPIERLALLDELGRLLDGLTGLGPGREALNSLLQSVLPQQRAAVVDSIHQPSRQWLADAVKLVDECYGRWKHSVSKLDFNDLERFAVRLLENSPRLGGRFSHVLVDEFQDTNPLQSKLIQLLRPRGGEPQPEGGVWPQSDEVHQGGKPRPHGRGSEAQGPQPIRGTWPLSGCGASKRRTPHWRSGL